MLLLPAVASVALLAGCAGTPTPEASPTPTTNGIESLEVDEILSRANDALDEAGSFHMTGSAEEEGQTVEIDAVYAGDLLQGSFDLGVFALEIIVAQDGTYLRADDAFWQTFLPVLAPEAQEDAAALLPLLAGKYVKAPASAGVDSFLPQSSDLLQGDYAKGEVTEYKGQPAFTLVDEANDGTLYISLVGEPYPLAMESGGNTVEFSDFGDDVTIEAPAPADVLDLEQLMG